MKTLTVVMVLLLIGLVGSASAIDISQCVEISIFDTPQFFFLDTVERSGCCSWHGGVCGCDALGRVICCDGTTSPSCTC